MMARILDRDEWPRLVGTEAEPLIAVLSDAARVIVVESDGQIIACQVLQPILHAEGIWIHPDHRKRSSAGRRLWNMVKSTAREHFGVRWMATGCASADVERLLVHVGAVKLPDHYMISVGDV